jgi:uncharacterized protein
MYPAMKIKISIILIVCMMAGSLSARTKVPEKIQQTPFTDVHFTDQFWAPRMEINRTVSIPSAFGKCEENGRFDNFALAGGLKKGEHQGDFPFDDTDPYKIIEGASYSLAVKYDPKLDAFIDSVITLIAAAQEKDGYLTTCVTNKCTRLSGWWGKSKWERINSHELYNCGHMYEAAVAHYRATGKRTFLDVAIKNADLVCKVFGPNEGQKHVPSGHPIVEMALIKLYGVTNDQKYINMARYFVDEAGRGTDGHRLSPYSQDHKPILQQDEIVGHAVRAGYLYSGVADVASLQNDAKLFEAVHRVWENMAGKKLYLNGGLGSRAQGEGFGPNYELNNFNNYCETCASIANVYWNQRMFLATGDSKYIDVLERALYNGVIAGVSLSGDLFFYGNPQASLGGDARAPWFGCACCPGNVTRFLASVPGYSYATDSKGVFINLYVSGNTELKLAGNTVRLKQETDYPWEGDVKLSVDPTKAGKFAIRLRIPGWVVNKPVPSDLYTYVDGQTPKVIVSVNGAKQSFKTKNGYCEILRTWKAGDVVTLHFDMPVRRVKAHESVKYDKGLLAMERGPVVYCIEGIDQSQPDYLLNIVIPRDAKIDAHYDGKLLNGVTVLDGTCSVVRELDGKVIAEASKFRAIPYPTWCNRNNGPMLMWTPETYDKAVVQPKPTIASKARMVNGWGYNDQMEPKSSDDINTPYHYWWLKAGTDEEIGYEFDTTYTISSVDVYWLAFEHYDVIYKAPSSWKLLYKIGDEWKEVEATCPYGTDIDKYNHLTFKPVTTNALKLIASLQKGNAPKQNGDQRPQITEVRERACSGGVIEWKVNP